jgi:hypothetical protein
MRKWIVPPAFLLFALFVFSWDGETWRPMSRQEILARAVQMIDQPWSPNKIVRAWNKATKFDPGVIYHGMVYTTNVSHESGLGARAQNNWEEFAHGIARLPGDYSGYPFNDVWINTYGNHCSGFLSICWGLPALNLCDDIHADANGPQTFSFPLGPVGGAAGAPLLPGDALNYGDAHCFLFGRKLDDNTIESLEQTPQMAQRKAWFYSSLALYQPIRRKDLLESDNPIPHLTSLSPAKVTGGGAGFTLTISGSDFVPNSIVRWNGNNRTTTYISGSELQAAIPASDIAAGGEFQATVVNPAPGGGISSAVVFPVSTLTMVSSPASATVNAGQSATYTIQLTPQFGSFDSSASFTCTGLPRGCTASFSPASIIPGAAVASTALTLTTKSSQSTALGATAGPASFVPLVSGLLFFFLALLLWSRFRKSISGRPFHRRLAAGTLVCLIGLLTGCSAGGDGNNPPTSGTPPGTYQITVQGNSGSLAVSTTLTLVVK